MTIIRPNTFETNSSSEHVMVLCDEIDYRLLNSKEAVVAHIEADSAPRVYAVSDYVDIITNMLHKRYNQHRKTGNVMSEEMVKFYEENIQDIRKAVVDCVNIIKSLPVPNIQYSNGEKLGESEIWRAKYVLQDTSMMMFFYPEGFHKMRGLDEGDYDSFYTEQIVAGIPMHAFGYYRNE